MYRGPSISARWLDVKQPLFSENHEKIVGSKSVQVKAWVALCHPDGRHRLANIWINLQAYYPIYTFISFLVSLKILINALLKLSILTIICFPLSVFIFS